MQQRHVARAGRPARCTTAGNKAIGVSFGQGGLLSSRFLNADDMHESDTLFTVEWPSRTRRDSHVNAVLEHPYEITILDAEGPSIGKVQVKWDKGIGIAQRQDVFGSQHGGRLTPEGGEFNSNFFTRPPTGWPLAQAQTSVNPPCSFQPTRNFISSWGDADRSKLGPSKAVCALNPPHRTPKPRGKARRARQCASVLECGGWRGTGLTPLSIGPRRGKQSCDCSGFKSEILLESDAGPPASGRSRKTFSARR